MIKVTDNDIDLHLTPEVARSFIRCTWKPKGSKIRDINVQDDTQVSGRDPTIVIKMAAAMIPISQEIIDDMKWMTHDEFVELARPLTEDQMALIIYRLARDLHHAQTDLANEIEGANRMRRTARRMFGLSKKKVEQWQVEELLNFTGRCR